MTLSTHKASIGRKLWVWTPGMDGVVDPGQAFDATVLLVNADGTVNVAAHTHTGAQVYMEALEIHDPGTDNHHGYSATQPEAGAYATWMPYQKAQMDAQKA